VSSYRVAVVGGGLGGLCLAHGLLKALGGDADVTVYERDASLAGRQQGYRLHLDARAGLALQQCLPPESLELFQASCAQPSRRMTVMTERLRVLRELNADPAADPYAPATLSTSVSRRTFREVLARGLDGRAGLHRLSGELIKNWHPDLRALHAQAEVDLTFAVRIRTSPAVSAWPPSRVTLLGDAIHAMSPARGSGANTALQDAATLSRALSTETDLVAAVGGYERQMRGYGYQAVAASSQAEAEMGARRGTLMFWLYRRLAKGPA
jgi:2-polyprenyl-6-methoxyphenol hydroxylase-like FAD-dependent oxidoreductase